MFIEFTRASGRRCSVAIDKIAGFFENDGDQPGCIVLLNCISGKGGGNELGAVAVDIGLFTVQCAESYEDLKRTIQQHIVSTLRQAMLAQSANAAPPPLVRPH